MPRKIPDEQIFTAALETVAERGFAGATTREIAAAADVNEVTLFRRFGSKAKLLEAALAAEVERFDLAGGAEYSGDLRADLTRVVELYRELVERHGRLVAVIVAELPRASEIGELVVQPQAIVRAVAGLIERYQAEGELEEEPTLQAVAALLGPVLIAGMLTSLELRPPLPEAEEHVGRFLEGHAAGRGRRKSKARGKRPTRSRK